MKKILNIRVLLLISMSLMLVFTACKDDDDLGKPDRLFRPIVSGNVSGTWVKLVWDRYEGTLSYRLQLSEYEDFSIIKEDVTTTETEYTFEDLEYNTQYYVIIKGIGDGIESSPITYRAKTGKYPTRLKTPSLDDMIDTQVRMRWDSLSYDSMRVFIGKEYIKTLHLADEDNNAKELIVRDLLPETTYTVKVFGENQYLGEMDYKTVSLQVIEGDYVDLRSLEPSEAYSVLTQAYFDELAAQYPAGVTVVLDGGVRYEIATVNLSVNTRIVTGLSLRGRAIVEHNGGIGVAPDTDLDYINLESIVFTDHALSPRASGNFGGKYLLDVRGTTANNKVKEINVIACDVRYKRGFFRAQSPVRLGKITIDNCLIDSIGGYGVINADHVNAYFENIEIKNTTVAHAEKIIVVTKPDQSSNSLSMENMTFCFTPTGTAYFLDLNGQTFPGGITVKNCIFGVGLTETVNGMRSASTNIVIDNSYCTSDLKWISNATTGEPNNPIKDLIPLSGNTKNVFDNPEAVSFYLQGAGSGLIGKVGDPRWW